MQVKIKINSLSTTKGIMKNGDIVDLPADEVKKILAFRGFALEMLPELPIDEPVKAPAKKAPAKRKRARNTDGTLKGDDPSTPDVNEAWTDGKFIK